MSADPVEREYLRLINQADTDEAHELSIGLAQYRELYKTNPNAGCAAKEEK